jgi:glycosidase
MHYPLRDCLLRLVYAGTLDTAQCASKLETFLQVYPRENAYAMYLPLGSHDTERILTKLQGDVNKARLALLLQFAYPGAPAIYYGDEVGMTGGKDPDCRGAFPWDESQWNLELRNWVKTLVGLRKKYPALRQGDYRPVLADRQQGSFAFARLLGEERILAVMNASGVERQLRLPAAGLGWEDGCILYNLLGPGEFIVAGNTLLVNLPPWGGAYLA